MGSSIKNSLCFVGNIASSYRASIYKLIDKTWKCDWYFGKNTTDIKDLGKGELPRTVWVENKPLRGAWYWQNGVGKLIRNKEYSHYLMVGELYCLSTWWILLQRRLLYRNKRVFLWTHGWYGREGRIKKWMKHLYFGMADKVLTYGSYAKEVAISQGFNKEKIVPVHNSLDHEYQLKLRNTLQTTDIYKHHFNNDNPVLIFIGRLTKVKQLDMLIYAISQLNDKGQYYNLILIGDGEEREKLETLVKELGVSDKVWFYGKCYEDKINAELIYNADLCVAPGNVGLTAMHTMVFGTPVLTHDDFSWQMPEFEAIIPDKTGAFFKRNDISSMMESIEKWFSLHFTDRENVRKACYKEIDDNWTPEYQLKVLKSVIGTNE